MPTLPAFRAVGIARRAGRWRRAKQESYRPPSTDPSSVDIKGGWYDIAGAATQNAEAVAASAFCVARGAPGYTVTR